MYMINVNQDCEKWQYRKTLSWVCHDPFAHSRFNLKLARITCMHFHRFLRCFSQEIADTEGTKDFLKFEKRLAESAEELKGTSLKEKVNSVISESEEVFETFQAIIDTRREEKNKEQIKIKEIASLQKELDSFKKIKDSVKTPKAIMDDIFAEDEIVQLVETFDEIVKKCSSEKKELEEFKKCSSEKKVLEEFINIVNAKIKVAVDKEMAEVNQKYQEWKKNLESKASHSFHLSESLPGYYFEQLTPDQELPRDLYNEFLDFHTFLTSKLLWGLLTMGAGVVASAAIPGQLLAGAGK